MRQFNVKVNGKSYVVEVEESSSAPVISSVAAAAPVAPVASSAQPAPAPAPAAKPVVGGTSVKAPMPGLILNLLVSEGASVKKNDKILVLEAMKMENDILASADGVVSFSAKKGDTVETNAILAYIK